MRPTGLLHLGHYHGVLKNWIELQHSYECFYFVADWHALTTHYEDPSIIAESTRDMVIDWLAVGVNPGSATLFVQSRIPEHAELQARMESYELAYRMQMSVPGIIDLSSEAEHLQKA